MQSDTKVKWVAVLLLWPADRGHKHRLVSRNRGNGGRAMASLVLSLGLFQRAAIRPSQTHEHVGAGALLSDPRMLVKSPGSRHIWAAQLVYRGQSGNMA